MASLLVAEIGRASMNRAYGLESKANGCPAEALPARPARRKYICDIRMGLMFGLRERAVKGCMFKADCVRAKVLLCIASAVL